MRAGLWIPMTPWQAELTIAASNWSGSALTVRYNQRRNKLPKDQQFLYKNISYLRIPGEDYHGLSGFHPVEELRAASVSRAVLAASAAALAASACCWACLAASRASRYLVPSGSPVA